ncbi:hypothetical protein [Desnuesiella massiliensis]|nr:hypothetical protein [Desnuesiella massiliensis]
MNKDVSYVAPFSILGKPTRHILILQKINYKEIKRNTIDKDD